MESKESLHHEIRTMAAECAVCERDARDAEEMYGASLDLGQIAHPEDSFDTDLLWHRREHHREKLYKMIEEWMSIASCK